MLNKINEHEQNGWATDYAKSMQFEFANKMYDGGVKCLK